MSFWFVFLALHPVRVRTQPLFTNEDPGAGPIRSSENPEGCLHGGSLHGFWGRMGFIRTTCFLLLKTKQKRKIKKKENFSQCFPLEKSEDTFALTCIWNSCSSGSWCFAGTEAPCSSGSHWAFLLWAGHVWLSVGLCSKFSKWRMTGFPEFFGFHSRVPLPHSSFSIFLYLWKTF